MKKFITFIVLAIITVFALQSCGVSKNKKYSCPNINQYEYKKNWK